MNNELTYRVIFAGGVLDEIIYNSTATPWEAAIEAIGNRARFHGVSESEFLKGCKNYIIVATYLNKSADASQSFSKEDLLAYFGESNAPSSEVIETTKTEQRAADAPRIDVLDKGYVILQDHMGSDLTTVNAARVSFDKKVHELSDKDRRLIHYLADHGHTSPFRQSMVQIEGYVPLMLARQWYKHAVGGNIAQDAWNESSRRYITENETFYVPGHAEWRSAPKDKKQGSGECIETYLGKVWTQKLEEHQDEGVRLYNEAMDAGIAPEQARLFLAANGMYVRFYWTTSLQSVCHFLKLRLADDAQKEIRDYAQAVYALTKPLFVNSMGALLGEVEL